MMTVSEFQTAVEEILDVPRGSMKESDTRDTVASWSSLADVKIVAWLSSECGIEPEAELMEAETFGDMLSYLKTKGVSECLITFFRRPSQTCRGSVILATAFGFSEIRVSQRRTHCTRAFLYKSSDGRERSHVPGRSRRFVQVSRPQTDSRPPNR